MAFSAAAVHIIFAIAITAAGAIFATSVFNAEDAIEGAWRDDWDRRDAAVHTEITISNAIHEPSGSTLTIHVNNTGSVTLDPALTEIIVDGEYVTAQVSSRLVEGTSSTVWAPGDELVIIVTSITTAPSTASVITGNGIADYWRT